MRRNGGFQIAGLAVSRRRNVVHSDFQCSGMMIPKTPDSRFPFPRTGDFRTPEYSVYKRFSTGNADREDKKSVSR